MTAPPLKDMKNDRDDVYAPNLIGKTRFSLPSHHLDRLMGRWFYAVTLTGRYTNAPESTMESDLNFLKDLPDAEAFEASLNKMMQDLLTHDFWAITLPNELETSSPRNPALFAYHAAQNLLKAPVLFSRKSIADLLDPALMTKKKPLERHHLFPRGWLEEQGITDLKQINHVANFALLEYPDNIQIGKKPPGIICPKSNPVFLLKSGKECAASMRYRKIGSIFLMKNFLGNAGT